MHNGGSEQAIGAISATALETGSQLELRADAASPTRFVARADVRGRVRRRVVTVPAVFVTAVVATVTVPVWLPVSVVLDLLRLRFRLPLARLLVFGICWAWIELAGLVAAVGAWARGRGRDADLHYELMAWWTNSLMRCLRVTTGLRVDVDGAEAFAGGGAIILSRHASLADSLVSAWVLCNHADLQPRYVLKRELLTDPCLDVVGLRVPNCFVDRGAGAEEAQLDRIEQLGRGLTSRSVAVIFPEGTRASPEKRRRALERIGQRDPDRAQRMGGLRRLLPPRPAGTRALLRGAPDADVVLVWHTGFDGLDTFGGILDRLASRPSPARMVARRVPRAEVPAGQDFDRWLDEQWLRMDSEVDEDLTRSPAQRTDEPHGSRPRGRKGAPR